jgi:hypothetical protein
MNNDSNATRWITIHETAKGTGISEQKVEDSMKILEEFGLVEIAMIRGKKCMRNTSAGLELQHYQDRLEALGMQTELMGSTFEDGKPTIVVAAIVGDKNKSKLDIAEQTLTEMKKKGWKIDFCG